MDFNILILEVQIQKEIYLSSIKSENEGIQLGIYSVTTLPTF